MSKYECVAEMKRKGGHTANPMEKGDVTPLRGAIENVDDKGGVLEVLAEPGLRRARGQLLHEGEKPFERSGRKGGQGEGRVRGREVVGEEDEEGGAAVARGGEGEGAEAAPRRRKEAPPPRATRQRQAHARRLVQRRRHLAHHLFRQLRETQRRRGCLHEGFAASQSVMA